MRKRFLKDAGKSLKDKAKETWRKKMRRLQGDQTPGDNANPTTTATTSGIRPPIPINFRSEEAQPSEPLSSDNITFTHSNSTTEIQPSGPSSQGNSAIIQSIPTSRASTRYGKDPTPTASMNRHVIPGVVGRSSATESFPLLEETPKEPSSPQESGCFPEGPRFNHSESDKHPGGRRSGEGGGPTLEQGSGTHNGRITHSQSTTEAAPTNNERESTNDNQHAYVSQAFHYQYEEIYALVCEREKGFAELDEQKVPKICPIAHPDSTNVIVMTALEDPRDFSSSGERNGQSPRPSERSGYGDYWDRRRSTESLEFTEQLKSNNQGNARVTRTFSAGGIRNLDGSDGMSDPEWDGRPEESDILPASDTRSGRSSIHASYVSRDIPVQNGTANGRLRSNERASGKSRGPYNGGCRPMPNGHRDRADDGDSDDESERFKNNERFGSSSGTRTKVSVSVTSNAPVSDSQTSPTKAMEFRYEDIMIIEGINPDPSYSHEEGFESFLRHPNSPPSGPESLIRSYGTDFAGYLSHSSSTPLGSPGSPLVRALAEDEPFEFSGILKRAATTFRPFYSGEMDGLFKAFRNSDQGREIEALLLCHTTLSDLRVDDRSKGTSDSEKGTDVAKGKGRSYHDELLETSSALSIYSPPRVRVTVKEVPADD